MTLEQCLNLCGGKNNISRVLIPEDKLIFAVIDSEPVSMDCAIECIQDVHGETQVVFKRSNSITQAQLLELGYEIAKRQLSATEPFTTPVQCEHRPQWHISPPQGLLNDPNGFIFHNGQYHMFYQWYPYGCEHKDKYWAHLTSSDLINWQWQPVALTPSDWFDSHGVFSGHALSHDDQLMVFYTGNTRIGIDRERHTTQCVATSTDGIHFEKLGPVIAELPPGVTEHIRDPKVLRHNGKWLMLLGAQTTELKGRFAMYTSTDLKNWEFEGLYGDELGDFGYMWECPDMFELDGQLFSVLGPQGIESFSKHNTIEHHNGIVKSHWNQEGGFSVSEFEHLDYGFDFYAPQTLLTPDGRRVMCGWMGVPDEIDQPSSDNGWVHQLTTMRELRFVDGKLVQWPIIEHEHLVKDTKQLQLSEQTIDVNSKSFDLTVTLDWGQTLNLFEGEGQKITLSADTSGKRLTLDRSQSFNRAQDTLREVKLDSDNVALRILADTSSIEVFINGGEQVMTSRVFTAARATGLSVSSGLANAVLKLLKPASSPFPV